MKTTARQGVSERHIKVLIVDDHPIVRQGLRQLLNQEPDLTVCGDADNPHEALEAIKTTQPDIVIVDLSLKESSGFVLIKEIEAQSPGLPVLVVSMHDESLYAERVLRAGARGYVMKQEAPEQILRAIRRLLSGDIYVSEAMTGRILQKVVGRRTVQPGSPLERLSDRELEVFQLIGEGLGTRQIAERLYLSVKTIEAYREHIKEKLNLQGATELTQHAVLWVQGERIGSDSEASPAS